MSRDFRRNASDYRRKRPSSAFTGHSFLIVTEGKKTEPNYLYAIRQRLHLTALEVEIVHPEGTDPITLTTEAIKLKDERKKLAKKGAVIEYDEIWVVFDLEKASDQRRDLARQAQDIASKNHIKFAISDPCFEYWLLLHVEYTTSPFSCCDNVVSKLRKHVDVYVKSEPLGPHFIDNIPFAVANAERCRLHHDTCEGNRNPCTNVDELIRSLNNATRSHLRFVLADHK